MKGFLNYDGYLAQVLTKIMYVVSLNLLFLICSIPLFTTGAASTAMYTVLLHFLQGDEPDILKGFLCAFRDNFKKSTIIWLAMLALGGTLALNYYFLYQFPVPAAGMIRILINLMLAALIMLWIYIFPVISHFENSVKGYVLFSVGLAAAKFPSTLVILLLQTLPPLILLFLAQYFPMAVLLLLFCGASLPAYCSGRILLRLFRPYEDKTP